MNKDDITSIASDPEKSKGLQYVYYGHANKNQTGKEYQFRFWDFIFSIRRIFFK